MVVSIKLWEGIFHATSQPVYAERFSWHIAILLSTMALPINYFSHKRNLKELFDLKDDDDSGHGYIEGRVFMVWHPHNSMFHIQLEVPKDSTPCRFTIEIPYMHSILLHPQDQILSSSRPDPTCPERCQGQRTEGVQCPILIPNGTALSL